MACSKWLSAGQSGPGGSLCPITRGAEPVLYQLRALKLISPELSERIAVQFQERRPAQASEQDIRCFLTKDQQAEVAEVEQILCSRLGIQVFCNLLFRGLPLDTVYELISAGHSLEVDAGKVVYSMGQEERLGTPC